MNTTIKLSILSVALAGAVSAWAAVVSLDAASTNVKTQVTGGAGGTCPVLVETIAVKQSANVAGAYSCSATHVGIGTANFKGRGKYYQIHSGGGNPLETNGGGSNSGKYNDLSEAQDDADTGAGAALTKAGSAT